MFRITKVIKLSAIRWRKQQSTGCEEASEHLRPDGQNIAIPTKTHLITNGTAMPINSPRGECMSECEDYIQNEVVRTSTPATVIPVGCNIVAISKVTKRSDRDDKTRDIPG